MANSYNVLNKSKSTIPPPFDGLEVLCFSSDKAGLFSENFSAAGPNCILVAVLKNCNHELLYLLAEVFNMDLKEFCFPDYWKVSSVVHVFKNIGGRGLQLKTATLLVFFLLLVESLKNL